MLLDISFLDDATRPTVPKLEGLTPRQRMAGEHLKKVHDHLRLNMRTIRELMLRSADGLATPADVAEETSKLALVANFRRFGNACGQHCQIVNAHHSIEDAHLFPALARQSEGYRLVTDRLMAEHRVVHELLEREVEALNALAEDPSPAALAAAREIYDALERVLLSHLGYEEEQIGDAIGYFELF
jgi:hypothetical protein